jgi:hypothetical protein
MPGEGSDVVWVRRSPTDNAIAAPGVPPVPNAPNVRNVTIITVRHQRPVFSGIVLPERIAASG